jgi:putative peptidoglycan lipid II flippase
LRVRIRISHSSPANTAAARHQAAALAVDGALAHNQKFGSSARVALGILLSRITGLIRERVIGHYFGNSAVIGVFRAAFKIPNLLSNLFGEGVLSAAFITVYAKLRAEDRQEEAQRLAAAVFSLLACACSLLVLCGIAATPLLIDLIAPGFRGSDRELTIRLVRILFPAAGMLVMSAWCLGVLNSHRRFLLSYSAQAVMNATMIAALVLFGRYLAQEQAVLVLAWSCVVGSILVFLVQLPSVLELLPHFRPVFDISSNPVRRVIDNFGPVFASRGVVQISAYIDQVIASFLGPVAVAALGYAQVLAVLPISLFSMSVSAAELPELSSVTGKSEELHARLRSRLIAGLRRIAFFIVPCAAAFLVIGDVIVAALYQSGRFRYSDAVYVWSALAGSAVGLLASSLARLYSSVFYALQDTRTPLRFAIVRVILTTALGIVFALYAPGWIGIERKWGVAGLTVSAGLAGWVEFGLLRRALAQRIGPASVPLGFTAKLWIVAFAAAGLGYSLKRLLGTRHPLPLAVIVIAIYGLVYFGGTIALRVPESKAVLKRIFFR